MITTGRDLIRHLDRCEDILASRESRAALPVAEKPKVDSGPVKVTTGVRRARELKLRAGFIEELRALEWQFELNPSCALADELAMLRDNVRMCEDAILELRESAAKLAAFQAMCAE